jgi:hypothetical protein
MPRVAVRTIDAAEPAGPGRLDYFRGEGHLIHLSLHRLVQGDSVSVAAGPAARLAYVWEGAAEAGGHPLLAGSVVIAEPGRGIELTARETETRVLVFGAGQGLAEAGEGGNVRILPAGRAPRIESMGASGVGGTLFADGTGASAGVWLHENRFPPGRPAPADPRAGIHSHDEDEIIFITAGAMRLGEREVGPGTAIAIAAGTLYGFHPADEGLSFVNFRAGRPGLIHFADGRTADEVAVWSQVDRPLEYLAPA